MVVWDRKLITSLLSGGILIYIAAFAPKSTLEQMPLQPSMLPSTKTLNRVIAGLVVAAYSLLSYAFLRVPLYHSQFKVDYSHELVAHRGGRKERDDDYDPLPGVQDQDIVQEDSSWPPENSMAAFVRCMLDQDIKADGLQMEINITKDGKIVVFHSSDLFEATGVRGLILDKDYDELPPLIVSSGARKDVGKRHGLKLSDYEKIPLLETVFKKFPNTPLFLDLKSDDPRLIDGIVDLVKEYDREAKTVWGSGRFINVNQQLYARNPKVQLLFNEKDIKLAIILYWLSLLPWVPFKSSVLLFPSKSILMNSKFLEHFEARGVPVIVYGDKLHGIDSMSRYEKARKVGVNGICADRPRLCRKYLDRVLQEQGE